MKKILYFVLILILFAGSFLASSAYHRQKEAAAELSDAKSAAGCCEPKPDAPADIDAEDGSIPHGAVEISSEKQQMIGVSTATVEKSSLTRTLRLSGIVAPDENRTFKINAAVDGIIREVFPSTTGTFVKKGQALASFYAPDIYAAEQGYLIALSSDRYQSNLQVQVNESRLLFLGMSAQQIEEMKKNGKIEEIITLTSPAAGFILSRNVSPEFRFQKGDQLYTIVKLDRVWIFADIHESEAKYIKPQLTAKVSQPELGEGFSAQVSDVLPLFSAATRTLKVRLEADNPGFLLKPDMFVDIEFSILTEPAISVPTDAVLDSGFKKTVFVDLGDGLFEPREVQTGWRYNNRVEVVKGLEPGERIATSGTFLIDSESRLQTAAAGMSGTLSKDPVSGVDVSVNKAEKAGRKSCYNGKTYYFETDATKAQFDKDPCCYLEEPKKESHDKMAD